MGAPVALSVTPTARTYRPSGPHMPMIAPGIEAAVITWPMAVSSRCAVPASISWAASVSAVFVVAVADDGDDGESLPHADTKINSATAIVARRLLIASAPYRGVRLHGTLLARPRLRSRTTGFQPDPSTHALRQWVQTNTASAESSVAPTSIPNR